MVLQDKYKRAASARYNATHASSSGPRPHASTAAARGTAPLEADSPYRRRALGTNASRYEEEAEVEPDEEDLALQQHELDELESFTRQQQEKLQRGGSSRDDDETEGDRADVDDSFGHLLATRRRGVDKVASTHATASAHVTASEARAMQDEVNRARAAQDLKGRFRATRMAQSADAGAALSVDELLSATLLDHTLSTPGLAARVPRRSARAGEGVTSPATDDLLDDLLR